MKIHSKSYNRLILSVLICLCVQFSGHSQIEKATSEDQATYTSDKPIKKETEIIYESPIDVTRADLYKLKNIELVDIDHKYTAEEMKDFQSEADASFKAMSMVIDWDKKIMYSVMKDGKRKPIVQSIIEQNNQLTTTNCKSCQENKFIIITNNQYELVLQIQPEDEWNHFVYKLSFKK